MSRDLFSLKMKNYSLLCSPEKTDGDGNLSRAGDVLLEMARFHVELR